MISISASARAAQPRPWRREFPGEMIWLWRGYDSAKMEQLYEMEPAEKTKPLFRVLLRIEMPIEEQLR